MSWAIQRRILYLLGVVLFFLIVVGGPLEYRFIASLPPSCASGTMRPQGASSGPCSLLDPSLLQPITQLWARSFQVRGPSDPGSGSYNAVAYIQNTNERAGTQTVSYQFGLYDSQNVLIAQRTGTTYIMPGGVTPVFESGISTGNRTVAHTYFTFTSNPVWEPSVNAVLGINVSNVQTAALDSAPRITATISNTNPISVSDMHVVIVVFDPAGNAFAASSTIVPFIERNGSAQIVFTWPNAFVSNVGRIDILPTKAPTLVPVQ